MEPPTIFDHLPPTGMETPGQAQPAVLPLLPVLPEIRLLEIAILKAGGSWMAILRTLQETIIMEMPNLSLTPGI